jgi:hypothetical protein
VKETKEEKLKKNGKNEFRAKSFKHWILNKSSNALALKKIDSNALNEKISYSSHLDNHQLIRGTWLIAHECSRSVARSWNT